MLLILCPVKYTVRYGARSASLPHHSFRFLAVLAERAPDPVSYEEIEEAVWGAPVTRNTLKQRAKLLRESLTGIGVPEDAVAAARSIGYRLTVPCQTEPASAQAAGISGWSGAPGWLRRHGWLGVGLMGLVLLLTAGAFLSLPDTSRTDPLRLLITDEFSAHETSTVTPAEWRNVNRTLAGRFSRLQGVETLVTLSDGQGAPETDMIVHNALFERGGTLRQSLQLLDGKTGAILWAAEYDFRADAYEKTIAHFMRDARPGIIHKAIRHNRDEPDADQKFFETMTLMGKPSEGNLLAARGLLDDLLKRQPDLVLARSLRARINADLVIRHGHDKALAEDAVREARAALTERPGLAELKYSLARAELAAGDRHAALARLKDAARHLPYLERDIQALERVN